MQYLKPIVAIYFMVVHMFCRIKGRFATVCWNGMINMINMYFVLGIQLKSIHGGTKCFLLDGFNSQNYICDFFVGILLYAKVNKCPY